MAEAKSPTERIAQLEARYQARFAGHPRVSRDLEELEQMLAEATLLQGDVAPLGDLQLSEQVATAIDMYTRELESIRTIQTMPGAVQEARLRMWAAFSQGRYRRHFAEQDRRTRDPVLLGEIRDDLRQWKGEMEVLNQRAPSKLLEEAVQTAAKNLVLFHDEMQKIRAMRASGTLAEQATRLATIANGQLEGYRRDFAGQPRISRRPAHLERLITHVAELRDQMRKIEDRKHRTEANQRNINLLTERVDQWREEIKAIRDARRLGTVEQRMGALASGANQVFEKYRENFAGQSRTTRDRDLLTQIIETLWSAGREMDDLDRTDGDDTNERNLRLVTDNLRAYSREWEAIREAQQADA